MLSDLLAELSRAYEGKKRNWSYLTHYRLLSIGGLRLRPRRELNDGCQLHPTPSHSAPHIFATHTTSRTCVSPTPSPSCPLLKLMLVSTPEPSARSCPCRCRGPSSAVRMVPARALSVARRELMYTER